MIFKNRPSQGVYVFAWNTATLQSQLGDAANMTLLLSIDGAPPVEMDATVNGTLTETGAGMYFAPMLQAETNGNIFAIVGSSTTADVAIDPVIGSTDAGAIPMAPYGSQDGLGTVDANNLIAGIQGEINVLDTLGGGNFGPQFALDQMATLDQQKAKIQELLDSDVWPELTAIPGATPTLVHLFMLLYHQARNLVTDNRVQGEQAVHNDADQPIGIAARSDDGTVFSRYKFVTPS